MVHIYLTNELMTVIVVISGGKLESLEDGDKSESRGKRGKMETIDFDR
jgi:hypothetical protein